MRSVATAQNIALEVYDQSFCSLRARIYPDSVHQCLFGPPLPQNGFIVVKHSPEIKATEAVRLTGGNPFAIRDWLQDT